MADDLLMPDEFFAQEAKPAAKAPAKLLMPDEFFAKSPEPAPVAGSQPEPQAAGAAKPPPAPRSESAGGGDFSAPGAHPDLPPGYSVVDPSAREEQGRPQEGAAPPPSRPSDFRSRLSRVPGAIWQEFTGMVEGLRKQAMAPGEYMQGKISEQEAQEQAIGAGVNVGLGMQGGDIRVGTRAGAEPKPVPPPAAAEPEPKGPGEPSLRSDKPRIEPGFAYVDPNEGIVPLGQKVGEVPKPPEMPPWQPDPKDTPAQRKAKLDAWNKDIQEKQAGRPGWTPTEKPPAPEQKATADAAREEIQKGIEEAKQPAKAAEPQPVGAAATPQAQTALPLHERPFDYVSESLKGDPRLEAQTEFAKRQQAGILKRTGYWLRDVFSPQTASKSAARAEAAIREARGKGEQDYLRAEQGFEEFRGQVAKASEADRLGVMRYIEGRSSGATLPKALEHFRDVADQIREQMQQVRAKLEELDKTQDMNFVEDYLHHTYEHNPTRAKQIAKQMGVKMGSGGFTKARKFATYDEAIANGFVPRTTDFIQFSLDYLKNAHTYIARQKTFEIGRELGDVRWMQPSKIPDGWTKLEGMHPNKFGNVAVASDDWAQIWNNSYGQGLYGKPLVGPPMRALRQITAGQTAVKLSLSAYHALATAKEGIASGFARGMGEVLRGHPLRGAASIAKGAASPLEPFMKLLSAGRIRGRGAKLRDAYLGTHDHGPNYAKIADLAARSGFRAVSYDKAYKMGGSGSLAKSIKRGTLRLEMRDSIKQMTGVRSTATQLWHNVGRLMETVADPLFERYVPDMKRAAFYDRMSGWLKQNPAASEAEQLSFARKLSDSIDNRFGEMNHDNIFWNKTFKETLQAGLLSYSWDLGTLREIGGGVADIARMPIDLARKGAKGVQLSQRSEYIMGMVMAEAVINATYQYLATGEPPKDMHDLVAPRTGGVLPADDFNPERPERARIPGQIKDVYGWYNDPWSEAKAKLSPTLQTGKELLTREDWRGDPIDDPRAGVPGWLKASGKTILEGFTPIGVGQSQEAKVGTAIGPVQRFLGISPATAPMQDPAAFAKMKGNLSAAAWDKKRYHDVQGEVRRGNMKAVEDREHELEQEMEEAQASNDTVAISRIRQSMRSLGYLRAPKIHGD